MTLAADTAGHSKGWLFYFLAPVWLAALVACGDRPGLEQLQGRTMGTSWHVSVVREGATGPSTAQLQSGIEALLEEINRSMSTYRDDSEISRFNAGPADTWFELSTDFYSVLSTALAIGWQTGGAYDVTVGPLVDLWGFGPPGGVTTPPPAAAIASELEQVGQDKLLLDGEGQRALKRADLQLDLSSIAKGHAVDRIARWLSGLGLQRYLVEVGGEMRLSGTSLRGDPWRIAIEQPASGGRFPAVAIRLTDAGLATSGDYRNFFELDGKRFSHSIDPRTGYPVDHDLVSVTVIERSAMLADAWATALIVLGADRGMELAQAHGLAVYFIQRRAEDFQSSYSPAFAPFLETAPPPN